jgi:predicted kinase
VVITGRPATGKSALAARLHARFGWPLLAKDDIKESLFSSLGCGDRAWSRRLSDASFELLFRLASGPVRAPVNLLEGNFRMPEHVERLRGTARAASARLLIVELTAEDETLAERLRRRASDPLRHAGHRDQDLAAEISGDRRPGRAAHDGACKADPVDRPDERRIVFSTDELDEARLERIALEIVASMTSPA